MSTKVKYLAQWYESDAFEYKDGEPVSFIPDMLHDSTHETLDEAKQAAFKNASKNDAIGWAGVHVIQPWNSDEEDVLFVNEIWKNKWSGWRESA